MEGPSIPACGCAHEHDKTSGVLAVNSGLCRLRGLAGALSIWTMASARARRCAIVVNRRQQIAVIAASTQAICYRRAWKYSRRTFVESRPGGWAVLAQGRHGQGRRRDTPNSWVHRLLTFDTRGLFFDSMGILVHGAMSMIRVHSRCRDKSSTCICLLSTRPSSTR